MYFKFLKIIKKITFFLLVNDNDIFEGDILIHKPSIQSGAPIIGNKESLWENGIVPFEISDEFGKNNFIIN